MFDYSPTDGFLLCGKTCAEGYLHVVCYRGKYYLMLFDDTSFNNDCWFDSNSLTSVLAFALDRFKVRF